jgi:amylosucrase
MYNYGLHQQINTSIQNAGMDIGGTDNLFYTRFMANAAAIFDLYMQLYEHHPKAEKNFSQLIELIIKADKERSELLKNRDEIKREQGQWFLSNQLAGMSLYVDRFCGDLKSLTDRLNYFEKLGINFLHLMPLFESPAEASDGGYAVSNFRKVNQRFGSLEDLIKLQQDMQQKDMYLMLDIVLNHTSDQHEWARKARQGEKKYQDYFYFYNDRSLPDQYDSTMPEVFPEVAPGNFTYIPECKKWVMSVFHNYQWDLNFNNPHVLVEMLDTIFFYANIGVDVLRVDAPAFIWKQLGTTCQNLPQAHTLLRLIKQCVEVATPGMALLGEAIVAPKEILNYFGTGDYIARECDFAYNATHMALQWDMLATGETKVMLAAQHELLKKPSGTSWITYTRCHDDIGLGYDDYMIEQAGYNSYEHRKFLKDYYAGDYNGSPAKGALFSSNPKTGDARISGSLASLCGLEKAIEQNDSAAIDISIQKILLMQAHSFFLGGLPMLFYGDEVGYTNDYSYLQDDGKSYDNRWMHRPMIDWQKNNNIDKAGTIENRVFAATQRLIAIRKKMEMVADKSNLVWMTPHNINVAGYIRKNENRQLYGVFNFKDKPSYLTWYAFKEHGIKPSQLFDHWKEETYTVGDDREHLIIPPYGFLLVEPL